MLKCGDMEKNMKSQKFLHISDLHFYKSNHLKSRKDNLSHFEIKKQNLNYISSLIESLEIGAIFISGDLELDNCDSLYYFLMEWTEKGAKVFIVFGEHDTEEARKSLKEKTETINSVYVIEDHSVIEDESLEFYVQGLSCKTKQQDFGRDFETVTAHSSNKPGVFITHPCDISIHKMREISCKYYAVGHIHFSLIESYGEMLKGRPGHLYSLWDGSGKAWPARAIVGEFKGEELKVSLIDFPSPQTVRLYTNPHKIQKNQIPLVIENCSIHEADLLSMIFSGKFEDEGFRGVYKGYYNPESENLEKLTRKILEVFNNSIFVTPSDSNSLKKKYGYSRGVFTAKSLLENQILFEEFMERIPKATVKTQ